ncbi:MAG: sterol desaturase family protein [bacterium]|nr:sterol desaturase family protein [bacterium]
MTDWLLSHEPALRLGSFTAVFAIMALWELIAERRDLGQSRSKRWFANLGISVVDSLLVRLLFPAAAVGLALVAESEGWGLLHRIDLPFALAVIASVILLDLAIYLQHVMFHAVPVLWRLHMVHHSDQDFDLTTGIRFHPVEIVLSIVIKFAVIAALGPPPAAVFLFAVLLNATSMFNHGNVRLPIGFDRWLRWILVTPDMHRVHHSVEIDESNSNFGFNLPWWDRLFGTYRAQPRAGHEGMQLGVEQLEQPEPRGLLGLLVLPFTGGTGRYAIGERNATESSSTAERSGSS